MYLVPLCTVVYLVSPCAVVYLVSSAVVQVPGVPQVPWTKLQYGKILMPQDKAPADLEPCTVFFLGG